MNVGVYLIGCAVAVQRDTQLLVSLVLAGQSNSSSQRNLNESQPGSVSEVLINPI